MTDAPIAVHDQGLIACTYGVEQAVPPLPNFTQYSGTDHQTIYTRRVILAIFLISRVQQDAGTTPEELT